jgi:hypothetical protein
MKGRTAALACGCIVQVGRFRAVVTEFAESTAPPRRERRIAIAGEEDLQGTPGTDVWDPRQW